MTPGESVLHLGGELCDATERHMVAVPLLQDVLETTLKVKQLQTVKKLYNQKPLYFFKWHISRVISFVVILGVW